jgi:hypothetical protein
MSVIGSNILAGASGQGAGGYNLTNSLRFRSSASAYLNRTPASAGNQKTWTWSAWVKRGLFNSSGQDLFRSPNSDPSTGLRFTGTSVSDPSNDCLRLFFNNATSGDLLTTQVFRDPSAWYHIIIAVDTTQATASNRVKLYVNGNQITSFTTASYPTQNYDTQINAAAIHLIGGWNSQEWLDGYLTEVNFIDGQALTPSSFGETSATTGVWQPIEYVGTYGTNGFYLPFSDNASTTTLGSDFSGNSNNWTTNNISLTAGATYDSMTDVPTLTSATASNFCVLNPLNSFASTDCSNANLQYSNATSGNRNTLGTIYVSSGKYYAEFTAVAGAGGFFVGIANTNFNAIGNTGYIGSDINSYGYYFDGNKYTNSTPATYGAGWSGGDIIGVALDMDAGTVTFYKNNVSQGVAFTGLSGSFTFGAMINNSGMIANFGQRPFAYTPPTGFVALNTFNLPTPTIGATASTQANDYFDAKLWTGNGSSQTISTYDFQPDFAWIKTRSTADNHNLMDAVRGATKRLISNSTGAEATETQTLTAFTSNGFSLGTDAGVNGSGTTYVGWAWKANGAGLTNTDGSITSTVSANTSAGFSVITYDGTASAGTVGHGLGVAPKMIIVKRRSAVDPWVVWHTSLANTEYLYLNSSTGKATNTTYWNSTFPTSSVFSLGLTNDVNATSSTYVAYVFSEIAGYSKFGSYTGNGSSDGTFVFTGFRPRYVMIKKSSGADNWVVLDSARSISNVANKVLLPNSSIAELTGYDMDLLSNGIKIRNTDDSINSSGGTYIYMAFAENPYKYSLAR